MTTVLLIDDEASVAAEIAGLLEDNGYAVDVASDLAAARARLSKVAYAAIVLDINLGNSSGLELLEDPAIARRTVLLSGSADLADAVDGLLRGAHDFVEKTADPDRLLLAVGEAISVTSDRVATDTVIATTPMVDVPVDVTSIRRDVLAGALRVQAELEYGGERHFIFERVPSPQRDPMTDNERALIVTLMGGEQVKSAAPSLGVSEAVGWTLLQRALRKMGLRDRAQLSRIWAFLA